MAESRLISAHPVSPSRRFGARPPLRPAHPVRPVPLARPPVEETESPAEKPLSPALLRAVEDAEPAPDRTAAPQPPRSPAEKALFGVLLLSLGLNLAAFLVFGGLTRTDVLFAAVILVSGTALLVLAEINRRSGRPAA
jgi:hypothetical protein